jgi:hypothetical protein
LEQLSAGVQAFRQFYGRVVGRAEHRDSLSDWLVFRTDVR